MGRLKYNNKQTRLSDLIYNNRLIDKKHHIIKLFCLSYPEAHSNAHGHGTKCVVIADQPFWPH